MKQRYTGTIIRRRFLAIILCVMMLAQSGISFAQEEETQEIPVLDAPAVEQTNAPAEESAADLAYVSADTMATGSVSVSEGELVAESANTTDDEKADDPKGKSSEESAADSASQQVDEISAESAFSTFEEPTAEQDAVSAEDMPVEIAIPSNDNLPDRIATVDQSNVLSMLEKGLNPTRKPVFFFGTLIHEGPDYTVTAEIGEDAQFPEDIQMRVEEILPGTDDYMNYLAAMGSGLAENEELGEFSRFFDISFVQTEEEDGDEKEITFEPATEICVQVVFHDPIVSDEETDVRAAQFDEFTPEIVAAEMASAKAPLNDVAAIETVSFFSSKSSVYGFFQVKKFMKVLTLGGDSYNYNVNVSYDNDIYSFPLTATLEAREISETDPLYDAYRKQAAQALEADDVRLAGLFDIGIYHKGEKLSLSGPVNVTITLDGLEDGIQVVHFKSASEPALQQVVQPTLRSLSKNTLRTRAQAEVQIEEQTEDNTEEIVSVGDAEVLSASVSGKGTAQFTTDSFSVFALAYTVDFEIDYNGMSYAFSIPGGGSVTLGQIVEALGMADAGKDTSEENVGDSSEMIADESNVEPEAIEAIEKVAAEEPAQNEEYDEETTSASEDDVSQDAVTDGEHNNADESYELTTGESATTENVLADISTIQVSGKTREFLRHVSSVEFSDPSLVWVGKITESATVGQIKEDNGLDVQYSAELTEEKILEINAQTVDAGDWALISLLPFTSEETLTVTMENGAQIVVKVTDAQIKKTVIDAKGDVWEITVTYDDSAEIPDDAELRVREILPEDEKYQEYYQLSLDQIGGVNAETERAVIDEAEENEEHKIDEFVEIDDAYVHIFDIEIWSGDYKVEPISDVSVNIKLLDAPQNEYTDLQVIHFGKESIEVMELNENDDAKTGAFELHFLTSEFSVYSVISVSSSNLGNILGSGPYALVTGIAADPGATIGYDETWGQDYFTIIVNANAMMGRDGVVAIPETNENTTWVEKTKGLGAEGVHAWIDNYGNSFVGGGATQWVFESAGYGRYRIFTNEGGSKKYITHNGSEVSLTNNQGVATAFTITPNSNGTVLIHDGNMYLRNNAGNANSNSGWAAWVNRNYIMDNKTPSGADYQFRLCKKSDDFGSLAAQKVSADSITTNANYVIYRKFEDENGNESLYALAHDGTFVRVYDGGDTIYWRETSKNIYWNYQLDGSSPVLFTQDPQSQQAIYINPNHSTGQTLSTTANGLTLLGKDNGEYSTAIECWDQAAYDYAGLHVTQSNDGNASLSTGTRVAETSDEFLFAVASIYPGGTAETVDTVDSNSLGIKITMFDYGNPNGNYAAGDKLPEMTAIAGSDDYTPHAAHALVKPYLEGGLPSGANGAMNGLFSSGGAITYSKTGVNHLFLQSYYDENGTFRYRSEDNYAYLGFNNSDFTVYRQAATPYTTDTQPGHTYYYHGHFMPFNDIDMNNNLSRLMNQYGNMYTDGTIVGEIPLDDGRSYEEIYGIQGTPNFYTGMKMEANFSQPRNGRLENGDQMIFKFTGDDDMWVYIDGVLVLDIGGIHEPLSGTINFATGQVTNPSGSSLAGTKTLYRIFQEVLNYSGTPQGVRDKINSITWKDVDGDGTPDTFADYTNHSLSAFYMERGAGASNLDIQFNLKVVLASQFTVGKEIPDHVDDRFDNQLYKFQATYMDGTVEKPLHANIQNVCGEVVYKDTTKAVPVDDDGYFYLRAGEFATFMMEDESIKYNVKEVELDQYNLEKITINGSEIEHIEINDQQATISSNEAATGYVEVGNRSNVLYTNYPKTQNLLITKHLTEDSAPLAEGENPVFEFRVYLETTEVGTDGTNQQKLVPYSHGPYYLTKEVGGATHYFTLTGVNNAPVDKGTTPVVCSTTGRSGSINSIPPEYTIVIPNLVVGTNFYVEERRDNIPSKYQFVREELTNGTYETTDLGATEDIIDRILARDETDLQKFDPHTVGRIKDGVDAQSHVYNIKSAVTITVKKEWDPAPDVDTTVTVELHRYAKIKAGTPQVTTGESSSSPMIMQTNASPANAPDGYATDPDFSETYILTANDNWEHTFEDQDKNDADGNPYYYYIVETACSAENYWIDSYSGDCLNETGKITITNKMENDIPEPPDTNQTTDLIIKKEWINADGDAVPTDTDTIKFMVKVKSADAYIPIVWKLYDGTGNVNEDQSGTYYVQNGADIAFTFARHEETSTISTSYWLNSNVPLTLNNLSDTMINPRNVIPRTGNGCGAWNHESKSMIYNAEIDERIYILAQPYGSTAKWVATPSQNGERSWETAVTGGQYYTSIEAMQAGLIDEDAEETCLVYILDQSGVRLDENETTSDVRPGTATSQNWEATLTGLPTYQKIEQEDSAIYKVYSYEIEEVEVNGEPVMNNRTSDYIVSTSTSGNIIEITNTEIKKVNVDAKKAWVNADNGTTAPDGAEVTFELFADGMSTGKTVILDGKTCAEEINADDTLTEEQKAAAIAALPQKESGEFTAWKAEWRNLPQFSDASQTIPIAYTVKETAGFAGYTNQNMEGVNGLADNQDDRIITNTQNTIDIVIFKVDATGMGRPLAGAQFTLKELDPDGAGTYLAAGVEKTSELTGENGMTTFTRVKDGYYEICETRAPGGYVPIDGGRLHIRVIEGNISRIVKTVDDADTTEVNKSLVKNWSVTTDNSGLIRLENATITVGNTPGVELPATGGNGTTIYTFFGLGLILLAGTILIIRRKRYNK